MNEHHNGPEDLSSARLEIVALSDAGPREDLNEDSFAVHYAAHQAQREGTLLVIADGLGGHNAGEIASRMVTDHLYAFFCASTAETPSQALRDAVQSTNRMVYKKARTSNMCAGMGSTVVAVLVTQQYVVAASVGDSRAYVVRNGARVLRTEDDTIAHELPGIVRPRKSASHVLTQALGVQQHVSVHMQILRIEPRDTILLCTDGISDFLSEEMIIQIISRQETEHIVHELLRSATLNGSNDNMSAIIARVLEVGTQEIMSDDLSTLDNSIVRNSNP